MPTPSTPSNQIAPPGPSLLFAENLDPVIESSPAPVLVDTEPG
jgi:hypothetical protein